jgi:hypothetical protein
VTYKVAEKCFRCFKVATAWCEIQEGLSLVIEEGEGEADGAKFGVINRNKTENIHTGRQLAVVVRETGARVLVPLPNRTAPKGRNPGPESFAEVDPILKRVFQDGSIQITDSAQAFAKSARLAKRPAAMVNHSQGQYSKFHKWDRAELTPKMDRLAESRASSSCSSLRSTVSTNMAEGFIGNTKKVMAKKGLLGGGAARQASLNSLAAAFLLKSPGLKPLGQAMGRFVKFRLDSVCPADCFETEFLNGGK